MEMIALLMTKVQTNPIEHPTFHVPWKPIHEIPTRINIVLQGDDICMKRCHLDYWRS